MSGAPLQQVRIATRGSALALWQADYIASLLAERGVGSEKLIIKTTADRVQDRFLHEIGGKGLFVKELEEALQRGDADLAVHSLKDMTASLKAPFALAAILPRHESSDIMIFRDDVFGRLQPKSMTGAKDLARFGAMTVGTGSLRRQALIAGAAPAVQCVGIRGNVDTRLKKLKDGAWDALILAEASLDRLNLKAGLKVSRLDPSWFVPCASQGALALETVAAHPLTRWLGQELGSPETTTAVDIERGMLERLGGDCTMPFGCLVAKDGDSLVGRAVLLAKDGREARAEYRTKGASPATQFLDGLSAALKEAGAQRILEALQIPIPAFYR